ncbi:MAG: heavy-metal-associated domain-containing protein [Micavibrio sp.]|nr:heavy-metal-associated domain-containing protein [Micavibrio sp.]
MRKLLLTFMALIVFSGSAYAETIKASVNGLVCAFCATAIEKTFKAQPAVETIKVDLETKLVTITTKPDQNLDDETVKKLITDAGYTITGITREETNEPAE